MKAIIIGSGISGLIAGCYLVKNGWEITIFEQYHKLGGVTAQVEEAGFKFDLGQMLIEGLGPGEPAGSVFSDLRLFKKVKTVRTERAYIFPDFALYKPEKYDDFFWRREKFKELFSQDAKGIDKYYKLYVKMMNIATLGRKSEQLKGIKSFLMKINIYLKLLPLLPKAKWDAQKMMEYFFNSEKLQSVFLTILADFVSPPTQFPGLGIPFINPEPSFDENISLTIKKNAKHPSYRYVLGGMGSIVRAAVEKIEEGGGKFQLNKPVKKIIIEEGRATGITCEDGATYAADLIISSCGAKETFLDMIGEEFLPANFLSDLNALPLMESVFMVHVGIDFDPSPYQKLACVYYYQTYEIDSAIKECRAGKYHEGKHGFVIFIPTYYSPELAPKGHHAVTIYTIAPNVLENGTWKEKKEELAEKLLIEAEKFIPNLRKSAKTKIILTPEDFKKIIRVKHHAFGGAAPIMNAPIISHEGAIEQFWFIGSQSESGAGLSKIIPDTARAIKKLLNRFSMQT